MLLMGTAVAIAAIALLVPPQSLSYHNFADHRSWLRIPNFGDVVSNVPFAMAGVCGSATPLVAQKD